MISINFLASDKNGQLVHLQLNNIILTNTGQSQKLFSLYLLSAIVHK